MFNYTILILLCVYFVLSVLTVFAELIGKRWTRAGLMIRSVRIRLREISPLFVCSTAVILIIYGLAMGDSCFPGIWCAIGLLLASLLILNPEDVLDLRKRRKKAAKSRLSGELTECAPAKELSELCELPELTPVVIDDEPNRKDNI